MSVNIPNSLGILKPVEKTRVVVAMSGGVDSSVVAALLKHEGYEVVGITLQLYDHGEAVEAKGACCAGADIHDARLVAARINIPHYVLDYETLFKQQVMDDFADSYLAGHTPIPCVKCNQTVKFKDLLSMAKELGADCLATGHYVQRELRNGYACLRQGIDPQKDQSYFLFATTPEQLDFLRFPLGSMTKDDTRQLAKRFELSVTHKPDSQDICFVPNGRYGDVVRRLRPGAITPGIIRHLDGRILGEHRGVIDYTIGQRRGLGIGGRKEDVEENSPLYVVDINPEVNEVIVGPKSALACRDVYLDEVNWLLPSILDDKKGNSEGIEVFVKLRNTASPSSAKLFFNAKCSAHLVLENPEYGIAKGQAGVIYDGNDSALMLGGGWISSAPSSVI